MGRDISPVAAGAIADDDRVDAGVPGTYTLVLALASTTTLDVGALGTHEVPAGAYAYTGSAFGPGGFRRVLRHRDVAAGDHDVRHWHVDYLTGAAGATLRSAVLAPEADVECAVADSLPDGPVPGFGASDCDCDSHLSFHPSGSALERTVVAAHERARR